MMFNATKRSIHNRGVPPDAFISELVDFGRTAPDSVFDKNDNYDIYNKVFPELGPYPDLLTRKAVLLDVMLVLAGFESEYKHSEGIDASRSSATTSENAEAGAWQLSYDARRLDPSLKQLLIDNKITDGIEFQHRMKSDHKLSAMFTAMLLRADVENFNRIMNGPVRKGQERIETWPYRPKLWDADESIYPWLSRAAVDEFKTLLS